MLKTCANVIKSKSIVSLLFTIFPKIVVKKVRANWDLYVKCNIIFNRYTDLVSRIFTEQNKKIESSTTEQIITDCVKRKAVVTYVFMESGHPAASKKPSVGFYPIMLVSVRAGIIGHRRRATWTRPIDPNSPC